MKIKILMSSVIMLLGLNAAANTISAVIPKADRISTDYAQTQYPVVFVHGMFGFDRIGTSQVGLDYWYGILPDLVQHTGNKPSMIWAARVSPLNTTELRGEQLIKQIEQIRELTNYEKVNLIGHSHGGTTIRYAAGVKKDYVASLTGIASPNKGTQVADTILTNAQKIPFLVDLLNRLLKLLGDQIVSAQGLNPAALPNDPLASAHSVSVASYKSFAKNYPIGMPKGACDEGPLLDNGIYNYSFMGVKTFTNIFDADSYILSATGLMVNDGQTDGLVSRCSAKFGKTVRDNYGWNHTDEINQMFGLIGWFQADPVQVYRQHLNRLKMQGL